MLIRLAAALVALSGIAIVVAPISIWHPAAVNAQYSGFDPNLIYTDARGDGSSLGVIETSPQSVRLIALPNSRPTLDLIAAQVDFRVSFEIEVPQESSTDSPATIAVWSPRLNSGYFLSFGPPNDYLVTGERVSSGQVISKEILGSYLVGAKYRVIVSADRQGGTLSANLADLAPLPYANSKLLELTGGPSDPNYKEVASDPIAVLPGRLYDFGGTFRLVAGSGFYKFVLQWLDKSRRSIGFANDWRSSDELRGWTRETFHGSAPPTAAYARLILGAGNGGTRILATRLEVTADGLQTNLLPNGDFALGALHWGILGDKSGSTEPTVVPAPTPPKAVLLTRADAPDLLAELPLAVTVTAYSTSGITNVFLSNYQLTLPWRRGAAMTVDDGTSRLWVDVLLVLSLLTLTGALGAFLLSAPRFNLLRSQIGTSIRIPTYALGVGAAFTAYCAFNALLFHVGYHVFDMAGEETFAYVGAWYSPTDLYFLPSTVTPAQVWNGTPYGMSAFPYGPTMALIFTGIGWLYRLVFADPHSVLLNAAQMRDLVKSLNVAFACLDGVLIYAILRKFRVSARNAVVGATIFLVNPATWFLTSVWGETQTISLFLLLLAIWFVETEHLSLAWMALACAGLSRPQLAVPAVLLAIYVLRRFPLAAQLRSLPLATIGTFVVLAPLSLGISPTVPADYLLNASSSQSPTDSLSASYTYVSLDAYNLWTLPTLFVSHQVGKARMYYSVAEPIIGQITYGALSTWLFAAAEALIAIALVFGRRLERSLAGDMPLVTAGVMVLLMFETSVAPHHFLIALALLILCRRSFNAVTYYTAITILVVTTFVATYGSFGVSLSQVGYLEPLMDYQRNPMTSWFMQLYQNDRFITAATVGNLLVLLGIVVASLTAWSRPKTRNMPVGA